MLTLVLMRMLWFLLVDVNADVCAVLFVLVLLRLSLASPSPSPLPPSHSLYLSFSLHLCPPARSP